jgi:hypothetical protein
VKRTAALLSFLLAATPALAADQIPTMLKAVDAKRVRHTIETLVSFGTRSTLSAQDDPKRGIGAARDWLYAEFQKIAETSGGRMTVELQGFDQESGRYPRIARKTRLTNVVATLRGTQAESADRFYVVSGHYDSMCGSPTNGDCDAPGANDDASGVAVVLEAARVMAPHPLEATVVFMAVAGEEQGLVGSTHFAEEAKTRQLDIEGMFTNDIVGHDKDTVRVFSEGGTNVNGAENDSPSRELARYIVDRAKHYLPTFHVWSIYRRDRFLRSGDHSPFVDAGYPAVRFTEPEENFDHQHQNVRTENGIEYGDLPKFVDFAYVAKVARVNVAALASLALAPARPRNVEVLTTRLTNDTDLQWAPNREPDIDHYEVVWRDTTSPVWQHWRDVGNVTSATIKGVSKDNYVFGVRAVDKEGYRSPATLPKPKRAERPASERPALERPASPAQPPG